MSLPLEIVQAQVEKHAVTTVTLNYYPGAHWDIEVKTIDGKVVRLEPERHWGLLFMRALEALSSGVPWL